MRRYATARSPIHERHTASIAPHSCASGSSGKPEGRRFLSAALYSPTSAFMSSAGRSMSRSTFLAFFLAASSGSKGLRLPLRPSTTSPYICTKRR